MDFRLDVNHLADRNEMELKVLRGKQYTQHGYNGGMPFPHDVEREKADVPDSFDWRLYGAVTPVKGEFDMKNSIISMHIGLKIFYDNINN